LNMTLSATHRRPAIFISFNIGRFTLEVWIQSMDLFFWYVALRHSVPVSGTWCIQTAQWFHLQMSKTKSTSSWIIWSMNMKPQHSLNMPGTDLPVTWRHIWTSTTAVWVTVWILTASIYLPPKRLSLSKVN
jgi:hypothetical protein